MTGQELFFGQSLFQWLSEYGYYIYPLLVIALGPVAGFAGGFFASISSLNPFTFFLIWFVTTTTTDASLFWLGRRGQGFLKRFPKSRRIIARIEEAEHTPGTSWVNVVKDHYGKLFFFLKVSPTVALTDILAVIGGMLGVAFKRHYIASFFSQIIWSGIFVGLGYYLGGAVQDARFLINTTGLVLGAFLIILFLYAKFMHDRIMRKWGDAIIYMKETVFTAGKSSKRARRK